LTESEIFDLVAFLGALTDPVVIERPKIPESLTHESKVSELVDSEELKSDN